MSYIFCFLQLQCFPSSKAQFPVHIFSFQTRAIFFLQARIKIGKLGFTGVAIFINDRKVLMCLCYATIKPGSLSHPVLLHPKLESLNLWLVVLSWFIKTVKYMELLLKFWWGEVLGFGKKYCRLMLSFQELLLCTVLATQLLRQNWSKTGREMCCCND